MFTIIELRIIRASVKASQDSLLHKLQLLDPQSDEAIEIINDLVLYESIIDTLSENAEM
ncbi:hypothetical protein [Pseudoalteromonas rhizosphaerae]|uniref:Uncharacterized protein n=1 Tax=Pseudoalteromonas rhizosphaerae TaxID=2518973 RepID=A0ABW8KV55_9GAMM